MPYYGAPLYFKFPFAKAILRYGKVLCPALGVIYFSVQADWGVDGERGISDVGCSAPGVLWFSEQGLRLRV